MWHIENSWCPFVVQFNWFSKMLPWFHPITTLSVLYNFSFFLSLLHSLTLYLHTLFLFLLFSSLMQLSCRNYIYIYIYRFAILIIHLSYLKWRKIINTMIEKASLYNRKTFYFRRHGCSMHVQQTALSVTMEIDRRATRTTFASPWKLFESYMCVRVLFETNIKPMIRKQFDFKIFEKIYR